MGRREVLGIANRTRSHGDEDRSLKSQPVEGQSYSVKVFLGLEHL